MKPGGERADELAPVGEPQRDRIEDRAGAERGDEGVDLRHLDQDAVEEADQRGAGEHEQDRQRPGHAVHDLQADRQDVPHDDAEADVQVDAAGHHRDRRGERQERDDRLVGEDRAEVEVGRKGPRQEQREEDDEQDGQDRQPVDRQQPADLLPARQARELGAGRLERVGLNGLHARSRLLAPARVPRPPARRGPKPRRAGSRPTGRRRPSSATTRPRSKTSARWQTFATSSKSVETMMIAAPACSATSNRR